MQLVFSLIFNLAIAASAGLALGLFYFGGLWFTVRRVADSTRPGILMFCSFVGRLLLTLCGFYLVMDERWERLMACLCGFLVTRIMLTRIVRQSETASRVSEESGE